MESVLAECKKIIRGKALCEKGILCLGILSLLAGIVGLIVSAVKGNYSLISLFCIIGFVVPIVLFVVYMVYLFKDNSDSKIKEILLNNKLTADEIMTVGEKLNINTFSIALKVRCINELGMESIPEWCARDGVLPTSNDKC